MLQKSYNFMMKYASHPYARWILGFVSFIESSFFPFPPDPLYLAMMINDRKSVWRLAFICTVTSVVGGLLGYYIGFALYESIGKWIINSYNMQDSFIALKETFARYGFWVIALKGLTPIPYKIVTITCGVIKFDLWTFLAASVVARASRFYMLAALIRKFGAPIKTFIEKNLTMVTTIGLLALIGGILLVKYVV